MNKEEQNSFKFVNHQKTLTELLTEENMISKSNPLIAV